MTSKDLATLLNGREYGREITRAEEQLAKQNGLVVVFGYSDDGCEFRGAIWNEIGCYGGSKIRLSKSGVFMMPDSDEIRTLKRFP